MSVMWVTGGFAEDAGQEGASSRVASATIRVKKTEAETGTT